MTNKQNADASESFRQLMAAYSKAFSSTPDSVKEEENADDTATTTENGTTPSPRTASILDADDETTETALEFNLERAKLLNRQKEQELEEQAQKIKRLKARNARRWLSIILRGILAVTAIVFVGIQLWNCNAIVSEYVAYMIHTDKNPRSSSSPGWQQASEKSSASYGSSHATSSPSTTNTVTVKPKNKTQNKPNWKKTP